MAESYSNIDDCKCKICLESWINNDPRILPCFHIFCLLCLLERYEELNNNFMCYICKLEFKFTKDDIINLPKKKLMNINKEKTENIRCLIHDKESIQPLMLCKTCKIRNLCENCMKYDHLNYNCKILLVETIVNLNDTLDKKKKDEIEKMNISIDKLDIFRNFCHLKIDEEFDNYISKIHETFEKRLNNLDKYILDDDDDDNENYHSDNKDYDKNNKDKNRKNGYRYIVGTNLNDFFTHSIGQSPEINVYGNLSIEMDLIDKNEDAFNYKENEDNGLIYLRTVDINKPSLHFTDDGYFFVESCVKTLIVGFKDFNTNKYSYYPINKDIKIKSLTDNHFFGIDENNRYLYTSSLPSLDQLCYLTIQDEPIKFKSIWATAEDFINSSFLLAEDLNENLNFFLNGLYFWKINKNGINSVHFFPEGHLALLKGGEIVKIHRDTGQILTKTLLPGNYLDMWNLPGIGLIVYHQEINEDKSIWIHYLNGNKPKLLKCKPFILRITKSGLIYSMNSLNSNKIDVYKYE